MKRIEITETDVEFRKGLAEILISEGAIAFAFEVPDDFDINSYEGLAEYKAHTSTGPAFTTKFPEIAAWLEAYKGTFEFYVSLKQQFALKGMLSEKQIACVQRAMEKDRLCGITLPAGQIKEFDLKPGTVLVLSKFISTKIAEQAGHKRAHRAVEVIEVEAETAKAFRCKVKLSARRTSVCGVCGLGLENPASVAAGIGPICADNNGISYGENSLAELEAAISTTVAITTWVPKKSIKEQINPDGTSIKTKKADTK